MMSLGEWVVISGTGKIQGYTRPMTQKRWDEIIDLLQVECGEARPASGLASFSDTINPLARTRRAG